MLWTLWRYVGRELGKTFLMTAAGLTVVLTAGGLLRPLREQGLTPVQIIQLVINLVPVMLTFSLPVAAFFACTLVYGRLAADNEISACRAGGVNLLHLMLPAFSLGAGVAAVILAFNCWLTPLFIQRAEKLVKNNLKEIFYHRMIKKGHYAYSATGMLIHADWANPTQGVLQGVAAVKLSKGKPEQFLIASAANVSFDRNAQPPTVAFRLSDVLYSDAFRKTLAYEAEQSVGPIELASKFKYKVKFMNLRQLREALGDPEAAAPVRSLVSRLRERIIFRTFREEFTHAMNASGRYDLSGLDGRLYRFSFSTAGKQNHSDNTNLDSFGPVTIQVFQQGKLIRSLQARQASFVASGKQVISEPDRHPETTVTLTAVTIRHEDGPIEYTSSKARYHLGPLQLPSRIWQGVLTAPLEKLVSESFETDDADSEKKSDSVSRFIKRVRAELKTFRAELEAEIHARMSFALAGCLLVILGTALGIIFKGGHILTASGVTFIPALTTMLLIIAGRQWAEKAPVYGIGLIWLGNLLLAAAIGVVFTRYLRR